MLSIASIFALIVFILLIITTFYFFTQVVNIICSTPNINYNIDEGISDV